MMTSAAKWSIPRPKDRDRFLISLLAKCEILVLPFKLVPDEYSKGATPTKQANCLGSVNLVKP